MNALFCILWVIDFVMFALAVESTVTNGVSGMVLFASEVRATHVPNGYTSLMEHPL